MLYKKTFGECNMAAVRRVFKRIFQLKKLRSELMLFMIAAILLPSLALTVISTSTSESELRSKMEETTNSSIHLLDKTLSQLIQLEIANVNTLAFQLSSSDMNAGANAASIREHIDQFKSEHPEIDIVAVGNSTGQYMFSLIHSLRIMIRVKETGTLNHWRLRIKPRSLIPFSPGLRRALFCRSQEPYLTGRGLLPSASA